MNIKFSPWMIEKVIIGKMFQLIVLTWLLTFLLNTITDKGLTYWLNMDNETIFTHNYSIGYLGLVYIIPAALVSMWIIKGILIITDKFLDTAFIKKVTPIAKKLTPIADKIGISNFLYIDKEDSGKWYTSFLLPLRMAKLLLKIFVFVSLALISLIVLIVVFLGNSFSPSSSGGGGSSSYSGRISNSNNKKKLKSNAQWHARQKEKAADHAWKHAGKQAELDIDTPYFEGRLARAQAMQRDADRAAEKARNL